MLAPESVSEPVPVFVSAVTLAPSLTTPEKVVEVLSPPVVSVAGALTPLLVTKLPATPASEPMLLEKPPRSSVAPLATVTAELEPKAVVEPACSVPALTVVALV